MTMLCGLTLIGFLALTSAKVEQDHPLPSRSTSVESNALLADIGDHDKNAGRRVIEMSRRGDFDRIDVSSPGTTLMEGITLGEASGRTAANLVRREASPSHRAEPDAASELEDEAGERHRARKHKAKRSKAVSWGACDQGECKCYSRRRVVIRYQRERAPGSYELQVNLLTNWYHRSRAHPYTATSLGDFSKGFTNGTTDLPQCGGDAAWAKDCLVEPTSCTFDTGDTNPYDAKAGAYCCNGEKEYCSYKCEGDEVFKCPTLTTDINFIGGMDPAGPDVYKRCYMAQYPHGMNPESATDADGDVGGLAD